MLKDREEEYKGYTSGDKATKYLDERRWKNA
jgi:hypothetical protein